MRPVVELFLVDAFTKTPFKGNPAAVCLLPGKSEEGAVPQVFTDGWMQSVAREMNLSETAFLIKRPQKGSSAADGYDLRWFTPTTEVVLCGHATLACAHILWERGYADSGRDINFQTRSGLLIACNKNGLIELDFPVDTVSEVPAPGGIAEALGAKILFTGKGWDDYLIEIESEEKVRSLSPDIAALAKIPTALDGFLPRGFIVTARAVADVEDYDFVSRFFAPSIGIDEDPVTGSAHCTLAGYWAGKLGKTEMVGYQASERGGFVNVRLAGEPSETGYSRVALGGQAVTVYAAHLEG